MGSKAFETLQNACLAEALGNLSFDKVKDKLLNIFDIDHSEIVER